MVQRRIRWVSNGPVLLHHNYQLKTVASKIIYKNRNMCLFFQSKYKIAVKCNGYNLRSRNEMKWNESGFRPPLCTYRLNWARRTSWGWWDDWDDTVLQTQDSKFEPWRSEAEHATSRSRRLPTILIFTRGWGRNIFVSFKPPRPGTEPRTLAWKAAVLTTTLGPPPLRSRRPKDRTCHRGWSRDKSRFRECHFLGLPQDQFASCLLYQKWHFLHSVALILRGHFLTIVSNPLAFDNNYYFEHLEHTFQEYILRVICPLNVEGAWVCELM